MKQIVAAALEGVPSTTGSLLMAGSIPLLVFGYFFMFWDRRKDTSVNKDDGQVGIKLVLYTLLLMSLGLIVGAVENILGYLLSGAKNAVGESSSRPFKMGIASLVAGLVGVGAVYFLFLPRTNAREYPQIERFAAGLVAFIASVATILGLEMVLQGFFGALPGWPPKAHALASLLISGGLAFWSMTRLGAMSGWASSVGPSVSSGMQAGYPAPGAYQGTPQAYQQHPGGYPPQQGYQGHPGGYQQQQQQQQQQQPGAFPHSGGGHPSQQGGGGGYPPQQGGGGGYPPR